MRNALPWLLLPLALVGIWLGVDLTDSHFAVRYEPNTDLDQWCDVNATFDCTAVARSKYSHIGLGEGRPDLPVSLPAVGFFAIIALLGALAGLSSDEGKRRKTLAFTALVLTPGIAFSVWLLGVQAFALGTWCIKCLLMDATVIGAFVVVILAHGGGAKGWLSDLMPLNMGLLATAVIGGLIINGVYYSGFSDDVEVAEAKKAALEGSKSGGDKDAHAGHAHAAGEGHEDDAATAIEDLSPEQQEKVRKQLEEILQQARTAIQQFYADYDTFPRKTLSKNAFDGAKGAADAVVTIVEFADFECPHCQMAAPQMKELIEKYGDTVELVFKNYPLGKKCNEQMSRDMHPNACGAAVATQCAGRQGQYWEMHDLVFMKARNGDSVGTRNLKKYAKTLGLEANEFAACLTDDSAWEEVRLQVGDGRAAEISGTPAFFVNGVQMPSPHPAFVEAAVRRELLAAGVTELPPDEDRVFGN